MPRKTKGLRKRASGLQTYVRVAGTLYTKNWSADTDPDVMKDWIRDTKARYANPTGTPGGFAAAAAAFIDKYDVRRKCRPVLASHMKFWVRVLGADRPFRTITADEINAGLTEMQFAKLAKWTIKHRRSALSRFFVVMDPKGVNPVRAAVRIKAPKLEPRGRDFATIDAILDAMRSTSCRKGHPSGSKIRARVIAATGIPMGILATLTRNDVDLMGRTVRIAGRDKGEGVEPRTLPLSDRAFDAFADFHRENLYGAFNQRAFALTLKRACVRAGVNPKGFRPYDLRHSFLTQLYRVTRDLATVARMGLHAEGSPLTQRYAEAANVDVDRAAVVAFDASMATPVPAPDEKLSGKVVRHRKAS